MDIMAGLWGLKDCSVFVFIAKKKVLTLFMGMIYVDYNGLIFGATFQ